MGFLPLISLDNFRGCSFLAEADVPFSSPKGTSLSEICRRASDRSAPGDVPFQGFWNIFLGALISLDNFADVPF